MAIRIITEATRIDLQNELNRLENSYKLEVLGFSVDGTDSKRRYNVVVRCMGKNGVEELKEARQNLDWLIEERERET